MGIILHKNKIVTTTTRDAIIMSYQQVNLFWSLHQYSIVGEVCRSSLKPVIFCYLFASTADTVMNIKGVSNSSELLLYNSLERTTN